MDNIGFKNKNNNNINENTKNSRRIAKNTLILYFRMLFLMIVSLFTSRVILRTLGVTDYGIYNVVGGFVSMFSLISAALTSACSRFLNYEMGSGDIKRQNVVFSTAVTIQRILALTVLVLSELIGIWYVNNIMVLPDQRHNAVNWCFQFSVFNFCMNLLTVPYNASIIAHEKMKAFAYVSIFQGVGTLAISYLVSLSPIDRLVFYAMMMCILQFSVRMYYQIYCRKKFPECTYQRCFDKELLKRMLTYSLWHLAGNGSVVLKTHGVNLVLNVFFGPVINAAKGISNQVESAVHQFSSNFMMAMNPQITRSYATGDLNYMFNLVNKGSRFSFYLVLLISMPIIINAEYILKIWLVTVPNYTVIFVQLTLISMMIRTITRPIITAQNATGDVRNFQLTIGGIILLNLPFSYLALKLGLDAYYVIVISIILEVAALLTRIFMLPSTIKEFKSVAFLKSVVFNCLYVSVISVIPCLLLYKALPQNIWTFLLHVVLCIVFVALTVLFLGCKREERVYVYGKVKQTIDKFKK